MVMCVWMRWCGEEVRRCCSIGREAEESAVFVGISRFVKLAGIDPFVGVRRGCVG